MMRPVLTREEYMALRDSEQNRKAEKRNMVQMNYSCLPDRPSPQPSPASTELSKNSKGEGADANVFCGPLKGSTTPSNTVGMDIDEPIDTDFVLSKKEELGLLMFENSATKPGCGHIVFRRHPEMTQEENLRWASKVLGVEYDKGAKDITRVFYTPADKLIYLDDELFIPSPQPSPVKGEGTLLPLTGVIAKRLVHQEMPKGQRGSSAQRGSSGSEGILSYLGIPYSSIIHKWWQMYNDGQEPVKSNRNTLTFELAVNLRHICGFDREVLDKVIPCYDGFSEQEKMACIDSALAERRTQMPKRLKDVLTTIRSEELGMRNGQSGMGSEDFVSALDGALQADELYHFDRLPKMPQGVKDSIDAAGHTLAMPTLVAIAPAIGALATGVKLDVHGKAKGLNLCSFIVGEFASGKGQMDDIIAAWMAELQAQTDVYTQQEEEWASKTKRMKSGKAPEQPKLPVRMLTLNNTVANIAERLANTEGKHSFSFTPEADNVALKWKQSVSDFSVMLRQAYDEARYDREAKSVDAVRVHIQNLLWNVTMCGTQDALYRVITNYTDGLLSRIAIARTPDNTFTPLADRPAQLTDLQAERIQQIAHLLPLMKGKVVLPKLEKRGRQWLEQIRIEAMKNDDRVLARQRIRGCVNAQRITCALWLPKVAEALITKYGMSGAEARLKQDPELWVEMLRKQQTNDMMRLFDIVADYLLDNVLYYFRERIETAYESKGYHGNMASIRGRKGKNDSIFERLASEFTFEQAMQQSIAVKGTSATRNSVHQMLKNWKNQGLIAPSTDGSYSKVHG